MGGRRSSGGTERVHRRCARTHASKGEWKAGAFSGGALMRMLLIIQFVNSRYILIVLAEPRVTRITPPCFMPSDFLSSVIAVFPRANLYPSDLLFLSAKNVDQNSGGKIVIPFDFLSSRRSEVVFRSLEIPSIDIR